MTTKKSRSPRAQRSGFVPVMENDSFVSGDAPSASEDGESELLEKQRRKRTGGKSCASLSDGEKSCN